jgi:hypothetical protein
MRRWWRKVGLAGGLALCVSLSGCVLAADMINPAFLFSVGVDPVLVLPQSGTVIVTFRNESGAPAIFHAYEVKNAQNPAAGARNFAVEVPQGQVRNEVLFCPVGVISLGMVGADGATADATGAEVFGAADAAGAAVEYAGAPLRSGVEYSCGDVISIRLVRGGGTGTDAAAAYSFVVEIVRGR